ncbi:AP2-like ethylene-responsive transcription factor AIL6 [Tanacetum coccineum]
MPFFFATTGQDIRDKLTGAADPLSRRNMSVANYAQELQDMKKATKQEFIASLKRKISGFSIGASIYRGVTRHHQQGRWQARIGRVAGNKDLYLGTFEIFKFETPESMPRNLTSYIRDDELGRQTLAGVNPVSLEKLKSKEGGADNVKVPARWSSGVTCFWSSSLVNEVIGEDE